MISYQQANERIRTMQRQSSEHADAAERASQTYTATMTLYNVAANAGDKNAMATHRETLHTMVDVILDSGAMIAQLTKDMRATAEDIDPTTVPRGLFGL